MKNKKKPISTLDRLKKVALAVMVVVSFGYISSTFINQVKVSDIAAAETGFPDIPSDFWAADEIIWAKHTGLMTGYKDGTFGAGDEMTEAQFTVILARYFSFDRKTQKGEDHWAQGAYQTLSDNDLRMPGLRDDSVKNREVTRGIISQSLAHSQGVKPGLEQSVAWMFEEELTTGRKSGKTQTERFDVNGKLTRAQAAVFFHRLHEQVGDTWKAEVMLDMTPEGSNEYTEQVRPLYMDAGVTLYARGNRGFATADPEFYHLFQAYQGDLREYAVARTMESNFALAGRVAETLGAPASSEELREAIIAADNTEEEQHVAGVDIIPYRSDIFILWNDTEEN